MKTVLGGQVSQQKVLNEIFKKGMKKNHSSYQSQLIKNRKQAFYYLAEVQEISNFLRN
jgi:hypothetical protein